MEGNMFMEGNMLKTLTKTALAATGLMLAATGTNADTLDSAQRNRSSHGTLTAIAEDGTTYSKNITKNIDNYTYYGDSLSNVRRRPPVTQNRRGSD